MPKAFHAVDDSQLVEQVDDWRRRQPEIPPRSEAVRELIRRALQAENHQHNKERPA
jgi:metal-responsive CopG/Arc/MetJ family transcriptional regulator